MHQVFFIKICSSTTNPFNNILNGTAFLFVTDELMCVCLNKRVLCSCAGHSERREETNGGERQDQEGH